MSSSLLLFLLAFIAEIAAPTYRYRYSSSSRTDTGTWLFSLFAVVAIVACCAIGVRLCSRPKVRAQTVYYSAPAPRVVHIL